MLDTETGKYVELRLSPAGREPSSVINGMTATTDVDLPARGRNFGLLRSRTGHSRDSCSLRPAGSGCGCSGGWSRGWGQSQLLPHLGFELDHCVFVFLQEGACIFASLADTLALVAVPGAGFLHDVMNGGDVERGAFARDALSVHDVEFGFAERRGHFILYHFDFCARTGDDVAFFDGGNAANIDAYRRVKLQCASAGGGFWVAEHDANFFPNLVDEDQTSARLRNRSGEFAQGLGHQARLQSHVAVAHFAIEFSFGDERGDGVDDQHINRSRAHQRFGDFECLLAVVRLRNQEVVHVNSELFRVSGIERVLGVDERGHTSHFLRLGNNLQRDGGFTRRFGAEDFDYTPAGKAADAQSCVEGNRSRGNYSNRDDGFLRSQPHDRALAKLLFDLCKGQINCFCTFVGHKKLLLL